MSKGILNKWTGYCVEDCDCQYCLYYGGRSHGEVRCLVEECICREELKAANRRERSKNGSKNKQRNP